MNNADAFLSGQIVIGPHLANILLGQRRAGDSIQLRCATLHIRVKLEDH